MPRTKKVEEDIKESASEVETPLVISETKISPLNADFGREDLNQIVGKLNEIINFINS